MLSYGEPARNDGVYIFFATSTPMLFNYAEYYDGEFQAPVEHVQAFVKWSGSVKVPGAVCPSNTLVHLQFTK